MKAKSKTETKPIYGSQIEGAANNISGAYTSQQPKITAITDQLAGAVPGILDKYTSGDPNVRAATDYNAKVLNGDYLAANPFLDQMVAQTGSNVRNGVEASLGTRGLTGGSAHSDIVSRALAQNETGLRFNNYNTERGRMDGAAALAPTLASAQYLPLQVAQQIAQAQQMPIQAASGAGAGIGGLLGQYTNTKQTSSPSLAMLMAQMAGNAASAYAGGA